MKPHKFSKFVQDERGAVAAVFVISTVLIIGLAALVIDIGYAYSNRARLQAAADAAALAGATQLPDSAAVTAEALSYADKNMPVAAHGAVLAGSDIETGNWDPSTRTFVAAATPLNAVRVATRRAAANNNAQRVFLAGLAGLASIDVNTTAIATQSGGGPFPEGCIMATNESEAEAFEVFGTATVTAPGCDIIINSDAECAMEVRGTPTVTTISTADGAESGSIQVDGTYCENGPVSVDPPPTEIAGDDDFYDPYAEFDPLGNPELTSDDCDFVNASFSDSDTVQPGVYCGGITWTGSGTATFASSPAGSFGEGVYVIKDGALDIGGNVAVDAQGAGFYLTGAGAVVNFKGTSAISLSAPTESSGSPMAGFIFFEDHDNPQQTHTLRGTTAGNAYEGAMYFSGDVEFKGTADGNLAAGSDCTILIADTIYFNGTTGFAANDTCSGDVGIPPGVANLAYRLVD